MSWDPGQLRDFLERHARRAEVVGALPVDADGRPLPPVAGVRAAVVAAARRAAAVTAWLDAADPTPHVRIGHELRADELAECSVVTVPYRFGDRGVGMLAILGPRRMPYGRLIALASGTARSLGDHLHDVEIR